MTIADLERQGKPVPAAYRHQEAKPAKTSKSQAGMMAEVAAESAPQQKMTLASAKKGSVDTAVSSKHSISQGQHAHQPPASDTAADSMEAARRQLLAEAAAHAAEKAASEQRAAQAAAKAQAQADKKARAKSVREARAAAKKQATAAQAAEAKAAEAGTAKAAEDTTAKAAEEARAAEAKAAPAGEGQATAEDQAARVKAEAANSAATPKPPIAKKPGNAQPTKAPAITKTDATRFSLQTQQGTEGAQQGGTASQQAPGDPSNPGKPQAGTSLQQKRASATHTSTKQQAAANIAAAQKQMGTRISIGPSARTEMTKITSSGAGHADRAAKGTATQGSSPASPTILTSKPDINTAYQKIHDAEYIEHRYENF